MYIKRQLDNLSPELQPHLKHGMIIDAGSSGSRIQIYSWIDTKFLTEKVENNEGDKYQDYITSDGLPVIFQGSSKKNLDAQLKLNEGISSYADKVKEIGPNHIKQLMDYAESYVPSENQADTEIYLFATAGMRLLTEAKQKEILDEIYNYIKDNYQFKMKDRETNIRVISGEEEGIFGWISTNYLQHGFGENEKTNERQTYNFIDLGGASTQIAFELDKKVEVKGKKVDAIENAKKNKSVDNIYELNISNVYGDSLNFDLFVITFLEFGTNEARRRYLEAYIDKKRKEDDYQKLLKAYKPNTEENKKKKEKRKEKENAKSNKKTKEKDESDESKKASKKDDTEDDEEKIIWEDPCLPYNNNVYNPLDNSTMIGEEELNFINDNFVMVGTGQYDECVKEVYPLLNSTVPCTSDSCLFNNIYSPYTKFDNEKFVGIGKYWDVLRVYDKDTKYDYKKFIKSAREFCKAEWSTHVDEFKDGQYPSMKSTDELSMNCFRSAYMENILHEGYKIPKEDSEAIPFDAICYVDGVKASWTLGALINQISGKVVNKYPKAMADATVDSDNTASSATTNCFMLSTLLIIFMIYRFLLF